jgi:hypothetical protein
MLAEIGVKPEKIRMIEGPSCKDERFGFHGGRRLSRIESLTPNLPRNSPLGSDW